MKNNVFNNSHLWTKNDLMTTGLPRPFAHTYRKDMAKIVPIPWQSEDNFKKNKNLSLIPKNERLVYKESLCSYCGIKINNEEICIRWKTINLEKIFADLPLNIVLSDIHPLHIECMKQARIFCPFMKTLKDEDFETGQFKNLQKNAIQDKQEIIENANKKNIKADV